MIFDSNPFSGRPDSPPRERVAQLSALIGIVMLSIGSAQGEALINMGIILLMITVALRLPECWPRLRREPFFWLVVVLCVYLVAEVLWLSRGYASELVKPRAGLKDVLAISGLTTLAVAVGLGGDARRMALAAGLAILSLVLAVGAESGAQEVRSYLAGKRATYGLSNNGPGVYMSLAILALICASPYLMGRFAGNRFKVLWLAWGGWLLLIAVFLAAVIFNQSRSAWLAALIVFPVVILLIARRWRERLPARLRRKALWALLLIGLPMLAFILSSGVDLVQKRLQDDSHTIEQVVQMQLDEVRPDSVGTRILLWKKAMGLIVERPAFGWGPGVSRLLIDEIPGISGSQIPHFHNLYVQILVENGVVGFLLYTAVFTVLVAAVWRSSRSGLIPSEMGLFLTGAGVFFLITSLVEIRTDDPHGLAFFALVTGLAYTRWFFRPIPPVQT